MPIDDYLREKADKGPFEITCIINGDMGVLSYSIRSDIESNSRVAFIHRTGESTIQEDEYSFTCFSFSETPLGGLESCAPPGYPEEYKRGTGHYKEAEMILLRHGLY